MSTHPGNSTDPGQSGSGALTTTNSQEHYLTNTQHKGTCKQTCGTQTDMTLGSWIPVIPTFSPELCLEILPNLDDQQVRREIDFNQSLGLCESVHFNTAKTERRKYLKHRYEMTEDTCLKLLDKHMSDLSKYDTLITNFSALLEKADSTLREYKQENETRTTASDSYVTCRTQLSQSEPLPEPLPAPIQTLVTSSPCQPPPLPDPVCLMDVVFADIDWRDVCKGHFRRIGSRLVQYFGSTEYRYGRTVHRARPYPENSTIDRIVSELSSALNDPSFNKEQVSCLITKYENGNCHIPFHSDDEPEIVGDIITVSLGATRDLTFRSKTGPASQCSLKLGHGTVYAMVEGSQKLWEHGILPEPDSRDCRVSLTFRRIVQPSPVSNSPKPPRIHEPSKPKDDPAPRPRERLLFLTDSLLRDGPTDVFADHTHCVKREMYQLSDILDHEMYMHGTKYVFISAGVNDISRYDHRHYTLATDFKQKIGILCEKFPETTFIFNSVLMTKYGWLNREINLFNELIFDHSFKIKNLWFFDSHRVCCRLGEQGYEILDVTGNGIHLTAVPKREITLCLKVCIEELSTRSGKIRKYWPLRREYVSLVDRRH